MKSAHFSWVLIVSGTQCKLSYYSTNNGWITIDVVSVWFSLHLI